MVCCLNLYKWNSILSYVVNLATEKITFVTLCNELSLATKCDGPLTFQHINDYWGAGLDTRMSAVIVSHNVATCGLSGQNCVTKR